MRFSVTRKFAMENNTTDRGNPVSETVPEVSHFQPSAWKAKARALWGGLAAWQKRMALFVGVPTVLVFLYLAWIFHWEPERGTLPPLFEFPMTTFSEKDRFSKFWTQYPLTPKCSAGRGRPHKVMWGACARICRRRSPNRASD